MPSNEYTQVKNKARLIAFSGNKILVLRTKKLDNRYTFVGGTIGKNESSFEAIKREAKEEVNIDLVKRETRLVHSAIEYRSNIMISTHFFLSEVDKGVIDLKEPYKFDWLGWVDINDAIPQLKPRDKGIILDNFEKRLKKRKKNPPNFQLFIHVKSISETLRFYENYFDVLPIRVSEYMATVNLFGNEIVFVKLNSDLQKPTYLNSFGIVLNRLRWQEELSRLENIEQKKIKTVIELENRVGEHRYFEFEDCNQYTIRFTCYNDIREQFLE